MAAPGRGAVGLTRPHLPARPTPHTQSRNFLQFPEGPDGECSAWGCFTCCSFATPPTLGLSLVVISSKNGFLTLPPQSRLRGLSLCPQFFLVPQWLLWSHCVVLTYHPTPTTRLSVPLISMATASHVVPSTQWVLHKYLMS